MNPHLIVLCALLAWVVPAHADSQTSLAKRLGALMPPGDRTYTIDSAGQTRSGRRLVSVEPLAPDARKKVVIVGGLDGRPESSDTVVSFLRWWLNDAAARRARETWQIAAVPCVLADACGDSPATPGAAVASVALTFPPEKGFYDAADQPESRFLWRWAAMQAPDLVIDVRTGTATGWRANALATSLLAPGGGAKATPLGPSGSFIASLEQPGLSGIAAVAALELTTTTGVPAALIELLQRGAMVDRSPLGRLIDTRTSRAPLEVARVLATTYPAAPSMSYIPALAWSGALRLSSMTGNAQWRDKAREQMRPFLTGEKPAIAERYQLTSLAGHLAFADVAEATGDRNAAALARKAADFILSDTPTDIVRFRTNWTDDMFMASSILSRAAASTGDARYADAVGRLLTSYGETLQRPDGLFIHAQAGPHPWGRGNGFAAFGLMEALTHLPADWPVRPQVLERYRRLMRAMVDRQAPDGMWRQVVDDSGSYRELTVTAMTVVAMARGVRLGWLDASYRAAVDRAWRGVLARIDADGELVDVCTGTGAGPTTQYYLDRAAISGADDRGGAMALTAALEMAELQAQPSRTSLQQLLDTELARIPARAGIWVKHLTNGEEAGVRGDDTFNSASVIKIPVMVLAFQLADQGKLSLEERVTIQAADVRGGSGVFRYHDPGMQPTLRDVILQMIITSDNTATDIAIAKVGGVARVNAWLKERGFADGMRLTQTTGDLFAKYRALPEGQSNGKTNDDRTYWLGELTPHATARMLEGIQRRTIASEKSCEDMLRMLRAQQAGARRLPHFLTVQVAHKTGDFPPVLANDVGIIYSRSGPIIVSLFLNAITEPYGEAEDRMGRIAQRIVQYYETPR